MTRRELLALAGACTLRADEPDVSLRIAPLTLELGSKKSVRTLAYTFEITRLSTESRTGVRKDVVMVPAWKRVTLMKYMD